MTNHKKVNIFFTVIFTLLFCNSVFSQCWTKVDSGGIHTVAVLPNGTLWSWGLNYYGQLGDGTTTHRYSPIQIGTATNWLKVSGGESYSLAIKTNGTLWAWGSNTYGQLGDGTLINKYSPIQVGTATDWTEIHAGSSHSFAIKIDGSLWAWGKNDRGQLGIGNFTNKSLPTRVGLLTNWTSISTGLNSTAAMKSDGSIWAWGWNNHGQLADGTTVDKNTPIQLGVGSNWQTITMGDNFVYALRTDGTLWAAGYNYSGQLGQGFTGGESWVLIQTGTATNWQKVFAGEGLTKAIKTDGTLWAWGANGSYALGITTVPLSDIPIQIGTELWDFVTLGLSSSFQVKNDGTLWGCGQVNTLGTGSSATGGSPVLQTINCPIALGLNENEPTKVFTLYPNPAETKITIMHSFLQLPEKIIVIDLTGIELMDANNTDTINIEKLSAGTYILQIYSEGKIENHKFIKR